MFSIVQATFDFSETLAPPLDIQRALAESFWGVSTNPSKSNTDESEKRCGTRGEDRLEPK